jgi:hypothetical protein
MGACSRRGGAVERVCVDRWRFGRAPAAAPTPESMMRFLVCGMGASLATASR